MSAGVDYNKHMYTCTRGRLRAQKFYPHANLWDEPYRYGTMRCRKLACAYVYEYVGVWMHISEYMPVCMYVPVYICHIRTTISHAHSYVSHIQLTHTFYHKHTAESHILPCTRQHTHTDWLSVAEQAEVENLHKYIKNGQDYDGAHAVLRTILSQAEEWTHTCGYRYTNDRYR